MASVIVLFSTIFFSDVLFLGKVFFAGDNLSISAPAKILFFKILQAGHLPLWNPFNFIGTPFLADINLGLLSPFNFLYLFLSPLRALTFSIVLAVTLCGIGMYWFCRSLKLSPFSSLIASVVFMFSGSIMTYTLNTAILNTVVWLPFVLASVENLIQKRQIKYSLLSSIFLTLSLYGGHIQYFYYISLFLLLYIISQSISIQEKVKIIAYVYIPTLFLSAVQLLPFLEYSQFSTRPLNNLTYAGSISLVSFIRLLIPNFFGVMKDGSSWGATADINGYVGIIPLLLSIWIIIKRGGRNILFFAISAIVSLVLAFGKYSSLYLLFFYVMPFFSRFRSPSAILFLFTFSIAVLTGYATKYFFYLYQVKKKGCGLLIFLIIIWHLFISVLFIRLTSFNLFVVFMQKLQQITRSGFFSRFLEYGTVRMEIIFHLWMNNISIIFFILLLFLLFIYFIKKQKNIVYAQFIFVLLVASELMFFAQNNFITVKESSLHTPDAIMRFFEKDKSLYRILVLSDPGAKPPFGDPLYFENEARKAMNILQPNINSLYEIQSITGYASVVLSSYAQYMQSVTEDPTSITVPQPNMHQIDELGVKYLVTAGRYETEIQSNKKYHLVMEYKDDFLHRKFHIYENLQYYPRAYILDENQAIIAPAQISQYTPNKINIKANVSKNTKLILTEMYYPGWTATVDGEKVEIQKYKIFRSIPLRKGHHEVTFSFFPLSFIVGALLSLTYWVYILIFLCILLFKEHQKVSKKFHVRKRKIKKNP